VFVPAQAVAYVDPLPQRYLTPEPGIGGVIKVRPEDFLVEEVPLYDPCGTGEHLYLGIQKTNVSHVEMISHLRRHFGVSPRAIGFAGMKDKAGVTRQTISILIPDDRLPGPVRHERINVLWTSRHTNKIRQGHLAGNRFSIRIREVDPVKVTVIRPALANLERVGIPNYFGWQRFGYRCNNHVMGRLLLLQDWKGMADELLGTTGTTFPEYQRRRRELFDDGYFDEAAAMWSVADRNELTVIKSFADARSTRDAVRTVGRTSLSFWISALQSAVFNRVLDRRLNDQTIDRLIDGDLAWKHNNGAVFRVGEAELSGPELSRRLAAWEVSPSGPLWEAGMTRTEGSVGAVERDALQAMGVSTDDLQSAPHWLKGARRPLRVPVRNAITDAGADEHGPYIRVAFDLPAGSYATVLLRELMKTPEPPPRPG
jgi:tRNA pseudouridine13 synthase